VHGKCAEKFVKGWVAVGAMEEGRGKGFGREKKGWDGGGISSCQGGKRPANLTVSSGVSDGETDINQGKRGRKNLLDGQWSLWRGNDSLCEGTRCARAKKTGRGESSVILKISENVQGIAGLKHTRAEKGSKGKADTSRVNLL